MFYENIRQFQECPEERWPKSAYYLAANTLPEGRYVEIPVTDDNYLLLGTTGYGKTTMTCAITDECLKHSEDTLAVFLETKRDFRRYIRPRDLVVSVSEEIGNYRFFKWNMVAECRKSKEPEFILNAITRHLFADLKEDKRNLFFSEGAQNIFKGFIRTILYCYANNPGNKSVIDGMKHMSYQQLIEHLLKYKPNASIVRDYFGYDAAHPERYEMPKRTGDLMAFLTGVLEKFSGTFYSEDGTDTIYDFLHSKDGRLFFVYDYAKRESSNVFFRLFLQHIIEERLGQNADISKKLLLVLDEAPVLEADIGLMQAATLGRGCNMQLIVTSQSTEKLYCIAPEINGEHVTRASFAGFSNLITFHPGDKESIEFTQKLFGTVRKQITVMGWSRYQPAATQYAVEPLVSEEDLVSLDVGECYIKIRAVPAVRVKIHKPFRGF